MSVFNKFKRIFQAKDAEIEKEDTSFCMMPWVHLHVTQYGTVTPCCQAPWEETQSFGNINQQSINEIWNGEPIQEFRKKLIKGEKDSRCHRCYHKEAAGLLSMRQITNKAYKHKLEWVENTDSAGYSEDSFPLYLDIRYSNLCNFRCRICGPWSSSRWHEDAAKLGWTDLNAPALTKGVNDIEELFEQLRGNLNQIEEVYFAGGEPLIMKEHYKMLDFLLENGCTELTLRYNTNFSNFSFKDRSVFDYWPKFKSVLICASLDDEGKRAEFQRKDQVWEEVIPNLKKIKASCPNAHFIITPTVSVFNIWSLPDFHKKWVESGEIEAHDCFPSILEQPEIYNIRMLPHELKIRIKEKIERHIQWLRSTGSSDDLALDMCAKEYGHSITYMMAEDWSSYQEEFVTTSVKLDALRNESTPDTFPELSRLFSQD